MKAASLGNSNNDKRCSETSSTPEDPVLDGGVHTGRARGRKDAKSMLSCGVRHDENLQKKIRDAKPHRRREGTRGVVRRKDTHVALKKASLAEGGRRAKNGKTTGLMSRTELLGLQGKKN